MDLVLHGVAATAAELDAIASVAPEAEEVVEPGRVVRGGHAARARRHLLLPALAAVQAEIGWVSPGAIDEICRRLVVPPAEAYGVARFYALLSTEPAPPRVAHLCDDIGCAGRGGEALAADLERRLGPEGAGAGGATWRRSPCLGQCDRAPAVYLQLAGTDDQALAPADGAGVAAVLGSGRDGEAAVPSRPDAARPHLPQQGEPALRLLARVGVVDPTSLDDHLAHGGYVALRRAVGSGPGGVIAEVQRSGLRGRGGAAFPTGVKWAAVAGAPPGPRELICNADESEPGTFKDRVVMEGDPFALIEAVTIAGFAIGAERGHVYLRGEYPVAARRLEQAIAACRDAGYLGGDVLGAGFAFDIELRRGQGAYICGEETALMESIEGFRGEPRAKPPFPTTHGLFGRPTVVNNVETLLNVPWIVRDGGAAFAAVGTERSAGTRLFCLSGAVARPGVYEVVLGTTLRELLELAGGPVGGLRAVLLGGAAGTFVGPDELDLPLTFEDAAARGVALGSGVVMAFVDGDDVHAVLRRIAAFFRDESCGQCVPCRVGVVRQEEALARYLDGGRDPAELSLLGDIDRAMTDASICGLGQTAASALRSAARVGLL